MCVCNNTHRFTVSNASSWCNITTDALTVSFFKPNPPVPTPAPGPGHSCTTYTTGKDVVCGATSHSDSTAATACTRDPKHPYPLHNQTLASCCAVCAQETTCGAWVYHGDQQQCFLLAHGTVVGTKHSNNPTVAVGVVGGGGNTTGTPFEYLKAHRLQAHGIGGSLPWSYTMETSNTSANLLGTIKPTPSADLAVCAHL